MIASLALAPCLKGVCFLFIAVFVFFFRWRLSREELTTAMAFRQCFLRRSELTKIVLPKVLQIFKFHLLVQGTEPKSFPHNIQCRTRPKDPPFSFFRHCETFFRKKNFPKGSPLQVFFGFYDRLGIEKSQRVPPFNLFGVETFFKNFF